MIVMLEDYQKRTEYALKRSSDCLRRHCRHEGSGVRYPHRVQQDQHGAQVQYSINQTMPKRGLSVTIGRLSCCAGETRWAESLPLLVSPSLFELRFIIAIIPLSAAGQVPGGRKR